MLIFMLSCCRIKLLVPLADNQSALIVTRDDGGTIFCTGRTTLSAQ